MSLEITVVTSNKKSNKPHRINTYYASPPIDIEIVSPRKRKNDATRRLTEAEMQRYREASNRADHASEEFRGERLE